MKKVNFGKLFKFLPKSKIKAGDGKEEGKYPFFKSGKDKTKKIDIALYDNESIIIGDGGSANIYYYNGKFSTSDHCYVVISNANIYVKYVYFYLKSHIRLLEAGFKGVAIKNISKKYISNIKIPLPETLDEQIKIANLLTQVESLIEKRKESITLLDELLKSTFLDMFGDPVLNEKGWDKVPLAELGEINRGVSKHRPRNAPELLGGKYPLIQTGDVSNADLYIEKFTQTYSDIGLAQSKLWAKDTLCITIAANIAKTAILKFKACFPDSVVGMEINKEETNLFYIHFIFKFFQKLLEKNAPQAAQKNINLQILRNLKVPKPDKILQDEFATIIQQVEAIKAYYQQSLDELNQLFGSLSQRAFRGELDLSKMEIESLTEDTWTKKVLAKQESYEKALEEREYKSDMSAVETVTFKTIPTKNIDTYIMDLVKDDNFDISEIKHQFGIHFSYDDFKKHFYSLLEEGKIIQEFDTQNKKMKFKAK